MTISAEQGLRQILIGNLGVHTRVIDRVFPFKAPQGAPLEYIIYRRLAGSPFYNMRGASGLSDLHFQVDGYARTYEAMQALREVIRKAVSGFRGPVTVDGETIYFRHLFIESDSDAFVEPQAAGDDAIYSTSMDLSAMCPESIPNR